MKQKKWFLVVAALIILVLGAMGQRLINKNWQNNITSDASNQLNREVIESGDMNRQIAVLAVNGMIMDNGESSAFSAPATYNHQATLDRIEEIKNDDTIKGLLLTVDSPGGTTYHSVELYRALQDLKESRDMPIYVSMGSQAASGGYMISMPADKIFADTETWTGSIGVILSTYNFSGFMEEHGISTNVYKSGDNKDMGSAYKEPSDEENKIWQSMIDESYNTFVDIVAQGRDMDTNRVKELADGRIYTAQQAVNNGLIDTIGYKKDALAALKSENELEGAQVIDMTPIASSNFLTDFVMTTQNIFNSSTEAAATEYDLIEEVLSNDQRAQTYYLFGGA